MPIKKAMGNDMWLLLHSLGIRARSLDKLGDYRWFEKSMIVLMPCDKCRSHYTSYINKPEYKALEPDHLAQLNHVHNAVNKLLDKKINLSLDDSIKKYEVISQSNEILLKTLTRVILTMSHHWNNTRWKRGHELAKIKHIKRIIRFGYSLIGNNKVIPQYQIDKSLKFAKEMNTREVPVAPTTEEIVNGWINAEDFYQPKQVYQMLEETGLTFTLARDFTHDTRGCECHNK